jgi:hypothetical protein
LLDGSPDFGGNISAIWIVAIVNWRVGDELRSPVLSTGEKGRIEILPTRREREREEKVKKIVRSF